MKLPDNSISITKEIQENIMPATALEMLKEGNARFVQKKQVKRDLIGQISNTANGQYPFAVVLSCIDSRIPTEIIFDQGIGDLFNARVAGNFVNQDILGSMEFACKLAGSKLIVIMGHTSCGAVKGACDYAQLGNLTAMLDKIIPAVETTETEEGEDRSSRNIDFVNRVAMNNVLQTIKKLRRQSPVLADMEENEEIAIVGAMYDISSGKVDFLQDTVNI